MWHHHVALNLHLQRALEQTAADFPHNLTAPISEHSMPWKEAMPSVALRALHPPSQSRRSPLLGGDGLDHPWSDGHLLTGVSMCGKDRTVSPAPSRLVTHHSCTYHAMKTLKVASISPTPQSQAPPRANSANLTDEVFSPALTAARGNEHGPGVAAHN